MFGLDYDAVMSNTLGSRWNRMVDFEIGVVYHKDSRFYIAVDGSTLVSCKGGKVVKKKTVTKKRLTCKSKGGKVVKRSPTTPYNVLRSISVESLCERWGITLDQFDAMMADHLSPSTENIKPRPRGTRRCKDADDLYWRRYRTGRIARLSL